MQRAPTTPRRRRGLQAARQSESVEHDVRTCPGARHSSLSRRDVGPQGALVRLAGFGRDAQAAEDTWRRVLVFFDRHLCSKDGGAAG